MLQNMLLYYYIFQLSCWIYVYVLILEIHSTANYNTPALRGFS